MSKIHDNWVNDQNQKVQQIIDAIDFLVDYDCFSTYQAHLKIVLDYIDELEEIRDKGDL